MAGAAARIVVIGAGIAGLAAAGALRSSGHAPVVVEKSRGVGGRLATRRTREGLAYDHGAPAVHRRPDAFAAFLAEAEARGDAAALGGDVVGTPGMSALPRGLAAGLDIRFETEALEVKRAPGGFSIDLGGAGALEADAVLVATPAPQAARLLSASPALSEPAAAARMAPCWTLMATFAAPQTATPDLPEPFAALLRQADRPGRAPAPDRWVAHATPDWSREHLERDREDVATDLLGALREALGTDAAPAHVAAHRWRYARVVSPVGRPCLVEGRLAAAGDWLLGPEAGDAHASGLAAAAALLAAL